MSLYLKQETYTMKKIDLKQKIVKHILLDKVDSR